MKRVADRYGLQLLLHEKPFAGVNGSGKHLNWSLADDLGNNLLKPGDTPHDNAQFLLFLVAVIRAVARHGDLLRVSVANAAQRPSPRRQRGPAGDHLDLPGRHAPGHRRADREGGRQDRPRPAASSRSASRSCRPCRAIAGDRNRTSPFAFTGNKFEFRAVGSSQSVAGPIVVLNTIVAESLDDIATQLEQAVAAGQGPQRRDPDPAPERHQGEQAGHLQRRQLQRGLARRGRAPRAAQPPDHDRQPARPDLAQVGQAVRQVRRLQRARAPLAVRDLPGELQARRSTSSRS